MFRNHPVFSNFLRFLGGVIATIVALLLTPYVLGTLASWLMPTDTDVRRLIYIAGLIVGTMVAVVTWNTLVLRKFSSYYFSVPYRLTFLALIVGLLSSVTAFTVAVMLNDLQILYVSVPRFTPIVMVFAMISYGSISEEVLYRHICFSAVMHAFKSVPLAQLVQVVFFVSQHPQGNPLLIASAAILLGQIYVLTKSFVVPAALHLGFNFSQEILYKGHVFYLSTIATEIDRNTIITVFNLLCSAVIYLYSSGRTFSANK